MSRRLAVIAPLLLALGACAAGTASSTSPGPAPSAAGTGAGLPSPTVTVATSPAVTPLPSSPAAATLELILEPDGLGVLVGAASVHHLPFGTPASLVRTALARALGPVSTNALPDCGQGARTASTAHGFTVLADRSRFVGWTDQGAPDRHLSTMNGLGIGSTLAQLRGELGDVQVERTTLGVEWLSGSGLHGLATSKAPTAKVTVMSGGEVCSFG